MAGKNKPLVLVVDANISPVKAAAEALQRTFEEIGKSGGNLAEVMDQQMAKVANVSAVAMNDAAKRIRSDISQMRREAESAARLGSDFNPAGGFTSAKQQALADNFTASAARAKQLEAAYRAVAASNAEMRVQAEATANKLLEEAATFKLNAEAAQRNADLLHQVEANLAGYGEGLDKASNRSRAAQAGTQQLGFQVSDMVVQVSGGTSAMRAFSMQAPQMVQALALMGSGADASKGRFAAFAAYLNTGWGAAILVGVSILSALAAAYLESGDAAGEAGDASKRVTDALDFERMTRGQLRKAIEEQRKASEDAIKVSAAEEIQARNTARANLINALAHRQELAAQLAKQNATAAGSAGQGTGGAAGSYFGGQASATAALIQENDTNIAMLTDNLMNRQFAVSKSAAEAAADPAKGITRKYDLAEDILQRKAREERWSAEKTTAALTALNQARRAEEQQLAESRRKSRSTGGASVSEQASIGDMTALLKSILPGIRITSTTGGRHVKGSDHYAGRAIDFVLPGQMSPKDFDRVKAILEESGIKIRRNANGTEQFFGPGHGANKPGDHDDHYHLAWEGRSSPESVKRILERKLAEEQRNQETLTAAMLASKEEQARIAREGVTDALQLAQLDKAAIDAALARKLAANAKLELDHSELDALDKANAAARKKQIDNDVWRGLVAKGRQLELARLEDAQRLLEIEGQIAPTLKARKEIAEQLLELDKTIRLKKIDAAEAEGSIDKAEAERQRGQVNAETALNKKALDGQFVGPLDSYFKQIDDNTKNMNEALEGVAAHGLQTLEEGLLGLIDGTESVASAFKKMAAAIIADLARIAIEKAILSIFAFKSGDVPGHATGHIPGFASGVISGPGTGTSDSILAWHEGMGLIRVSNGESIITAEGTRKHRGLLRAINDDSLPSFAAGMIANVAYPAVPNSASLRGANDNAPVQYYDLRGSVVLEQLYREMHQISAAHAAQALAAAPALTQEELGDSAMQRIPV